MKTMTASLLLLLLMLAITGPVIALPTVVITSGEITGELTAGVDLHWDLHGAGFDSSGVRTGVFFPSNPLVETFLIPEFFGSPPFPSTYIHFQVDGGVSISSIPNPGDHQTVPFTFTGDAGSVETASQLPPMFILHPEVVLVGQGVLTATNVQTGFFLYDYKFTVPEPSTLLLLGSGIFAIGMTARRHKKR